MGTSTRRGNWRKVVTVKARQCRSFAAEGETGLLGGPGSSLAITKLANGAFEVPEVTAGSYQLTAEAAEGGEQISAAEIVEVGSDDRSLHVVLKRPGEMKGVPRVEGNSRLPKTAYGWRALLPRSLVGLQATDPLKTICYHHRLQLDDRKKEVTGAAAHGLQCSIANAFNDVSQAEQECLSVINEQSASKFHVEARANLAEVYWRNGMVRKALRYWEERNNGICETYLLDLFESVAPVFAPERARSLDTAGRFGS